MSKSLRLLVGIGLGVLGAEIATNGAVSREARSIASFARRDPEIRRDLGKLAAIIVEAAL